uniref:Putative secreted protein n=1 Tax=Anopheles triannulatus TaxID=58253 RepID=A0A2M4B2E2_9DIPT
MAFEAMRLRLCCCCCCCCGWGMGSLAGGLGICGTARRNFKQPLQLQHQLLLGFTHFFTLFDTINKQ